MEIKTNLSMKCQILKKDSTKSFSYLAGINRAINPSQVTKLAKSVNKLGILRPIVIANIPFINGKPTDYIIDGQHLFNALLRNNMDIPYILINIKNKVELVESIALLNASSKNWAMIDYVTSWSCVSEDYKKLLHYYNVYDFELSALSAILSGRLSSANGGGMSMIIKKGEFKVVDEKLNVTTLDCLTDVLDILPRMNRFENRYVCAEYISFLRSFSSYNHEKFMKNLKLQKELFILATQQQEKLSEMFKKLTK